MRIDWAALGIVAVVSICVSVMFVVLLAAGIRLVSVARGWQNNQGRIGQGGARAGYGLIGLAGLLVLVGLYMIVPQFPLSHGRRASRQGPAAGASIGRDEDRRCVDSRVRARLSADASRAGLCRSRATTSPWPAVSHSSAGSRCRPCRSSR